MKRRKKGLGGTPLEHKRQARRELSHVIEDVRRGRKNLELGQCSDTFSAIVRAEKTYGRELAERTWSPSAHEMRSRFQKVNAALSLLRADFREKCICSRKKR